MNSKETILKSLKELKDEIKIKYRVTELGVFGSVARGEDNVSSDVDIMAEFDEDADLLDLMGLSLFLEERLQRKVDVVSKRALRSETQDAVLREVAIV